MGQTTTPMDLISFLYREMPVEQARALRRELALDALLRAQLEELDAARQLLPKATFAPEEATLSRILDYSRNKAIQA